MDSASGSDASQSLASQFRLTIVTDSTTPIDNFGIVRELSGDPRRQAVPSIRGTVYQAWCSIDAWLQLSTADQVIYLEGAEDFDVVGTDSAVTIQVRHTAAPISLGAAKAKEALQHFWSLVTSEPTRQVEYHYLTTSAVSVEADGDFGGLSGLDAWRAARTNSELARLVAEYLVEHLPPQSILRSFLASATTVEMQERFFSRFHWLTGQPGIEAVQQSVDERIRVLLHYLKRSGSLSPQVRIQLESRFWQLVVKTVSSERRLTLADLLEQVDIATTTYLPVPADQIADVLSGGRQGVGLLRLLREKVPQPPSPLIQRTDLVRRIEAAVNQRRSILLTGTVFKGKTTVAQQVASTLCPDAWWINLSGRQADQIDNLLLNLAAEIDGQACPALIVIDDLDISPSVLRAYHSSLALVLHRTRTSGRVLIISAQGSTIDVAQAAQWDGIDVVDVPELYPKEVEQLCVQEGCPDEDAGFWGATVCTLSAGHPKLVQVRISELVERGWQRPSAEYLVTPSFAADSVRRLTRRLLGESAAPEIVEFLYSASECSVLLHRNVAIKLAELVGGIRNPGDVLDRLAGKWLDCIEGNRFRATPLLNGAAAEAWSPEQRAIAHIRLHDSIRSKDSLSPGEAAALLFHAFVGQEPQRLAAAAMTLRILENDEAREAVKRSLLWLPYVALAAGERVINDAAAASAFRALQFDVAVTLDSDTLPNICARWVEESDRVSHAQMRMGMQVVMWSSIVIADTAKVPFRMRLDAILALTSLRPDGEIGAAVVEGHASFLRATNAITDDIPATATEPQILLALSVRWMRGAARLRDLLDWLNICATDELRRDFDSILEWPIVQISGAFVQSAWVAVHKDATDWISWLSLFDLARDYAIDRASPNLGREAAKAKAIVLTEYLSRSDEALQVLDAAEQEFGSSPILSEQRVNVLFQTNDDEQVLILWRQLVANNRSVSDPFAYRRVAISAARLGEWAKSEELFRTAAAFASTLGDGWIRFGLLVDCALSASLGGSLREAVEILGSALEVLPSSAAEEGDDRAEAYQRAASEVCRYIECAQWTPAEAKPKFLAGYPSDPGLRVPQSAAGQRLRTALLHGQVMKLSGCLGVNTALVNSSAAADMGASPYPYVRWLVAEARLASSFSNVGADFIGCYARFLEATATIQSLGSQNLKEHESSVGVGMVAANQWLGILVAGACCAGCELMDRLTDWLDLVRGSPVMLNGLEDLLGRLYAGAKLEARDELWNLAADPRADVGKRCGAVAKLRLYPLSPADLFRIQDWLTAAIMSDPSAACQDLFNLHLAREFARQWLGVLQNPFQLPVPKITVPIIRSSVSQVLAGRGTLRTLLGQIAQALGLPLSELTSGPLR